MKPVVGILALQGDFDLHRRVVTELGYPGVLVRNPDELKQCAGLIIPGGESTTMTNLLIKHGLWDDLGQFAQLKPVFGTCAGLVLLSAQIINNPLEIKTLGVINIKVQRNAYGRQIDSFTDDLKMNLNGHMEKMEGVFIRAPKISSMGPYVVPKAWHKEDVVLVEENNILAATFHPELTKDTRIHQYFLNKFNSL
jgi:pyridoxal 5'-phosphate synthase pdxT subunit